MRDEGFKPREDEDMCREARIAVEKWREYFKYNHDQYHQMMQFVLGRQWEDDEEDMLTTTLNKVPLQFNKLATLVNTLLGEQQQNTPQIEVAPLSNCNEETAEIRQTVVKDAMLSTDSKTVYQQAFFQAAVGGFGAYIVDTDYTHSRSFDQEIVYRAVKDATRCYWDQGANEVSKIDGMRAGYIARMTREKFRAVYGKDIEEKILSNKSAPTASEQEVALAVEPNTSANPFMWSDDESITLLHDFKRSYKPDTLYKLSNGSVYNKSELEEIIEQSKIHNEMQMMQSMQMDEYGNQMANQSMMDGQMGDLGDALPEMEAAIEDEEISDDLSLNTMMLYDMGEPVRIVERMPWKQSIITERIMAGNYILGEREFPSDDLPVIFTDQNSFYDEKGRQVCRPFVIDAVDAQRFLNYLGTQTAYLLKISRYDQFIGSKKNVQSLDTQAQWKDPTNVKGMLTYDESPSGAKPEQLRPPEISQSLMVQYQRAIDDMYTSTGLYPTRMGQEGNEVSGKAIDARTRQGSYSTFVAFNSINRAITAGGKIVNQMIPRVYDTERVLNLMTPDRGRQNITVNQAQDEYGMRVKNDLRKGVFEVRLQAGPSYEGQKTEALESLSLVLNANPDLFPMFADLWAENLPLANTIEIKNRLKTLVPPDILEAGKTGNMPKEAQQPNPQAQAIAAEIQFKQQQIEIEKQKLQIKMAEAEAAVEKARMELEMKGLELAAQLEETKLRYMAETDRTRSDNAISHADNMTKILLQHTKESNNARATQS
jgi:hypothetical protein